MMTENRKQEIIDRNPEWLTPYLMKIFHDAPEIDNSVTVEGIAEEWSKLDDRYPSRAHSLKEAIKAYEKSYKYDAEFVRKTTGQELPKLEIKVEDSKYILNEDKSTASLEKMQRDVEFVKDVIENDGNPLSLLFDEERESFYGTVLDEDIMKKAYRVNDLLEIVAIGSNVEVQKFEEPKPRSSSAVFALTFKGLNSINQTAMKAFKEITQIVDEVIIIPRENETTRISFVLDGLWAEHTNIDQNDEPEDEYF